MGIIDKIITNAFNKAESLCIDSNSKLIFFSDMHKGDNSYADDFAHNMQIYEEALQHYYKEDFTYFELGDGVELWENKSFKPIYNAYKSIFDLQLKFHQENRLHLLFGNHDMVFKDKNVVEAMLNKFFIDKQSKDKKLLFDVDFKESILLEVENTENSISTFENFMVEQKNDTLKFFIYKFIYDETYPDFFPYETTIQNVDDNQINSENFNEYLKDGYVTGGDGCLYYHHDAQFIPYSQEVIDMYGYEQGSGITIVPYDELIFCAKELDAGPSTSSGGYSSTAGDDYADGDYGNGTDTGDSTDNDNTYGGGNTDDTNNGQNTSNPNVDNINKPASYVVLPPKASNLINSLENLLNINFNNSQELWISQNLVKAKQINDFLNANPNSQEAIYLAQLVFETIMNNPNNNISSLLAYPITDGAILGNCNDTIIKKTMLVQGFSNTSFGSNIENSFFEPSNRHIFITSSATNNNDAAVTKYNRVPIQQPPLTGETVVMVLSPNYLSEASDIAVVTTVIHELLHAYIINLYHDNLLLTTYPQYTDLNTAFNEYVNDPNYPNELLIDSVIKTNLDNKMHDIYVDFIDDLAENVFGYATRKGIEVNNSPLSLDYAKNLVWGSLEGSNVFSQCPNPIQAHSNFDNEINNRSNGSNTKSCN